MLNMYWYELKRFAKNYLKFIAIGSVIIGIVFSLALTFLGNSIEPVTNVDEEDIDTEDIFANESRPAYFRFYIRHPDGRVFNNSATVNELFTTQVMQEIVLSETGVDLLSIKEEVRLEGGYEEFSPAKVIMNGSSNIYTAIFDTGDNQDNLNVAEFYSEYLLAENFQPLEGNFIYSITNPQLTEEVVIEEDSIADSQDISFNVLIYAVIGLFIGVAITIIIALIKEFFSKKLNYAFTYIPEETNHFIVYDTTLNDQDLLNYFLGNSEKNKIILSENDINSEFEPFFNNYDVEQSLTNSNMDSNNQEVIIVVFSGETTRKWFKSQVNLSGLQSLPVKTIQINN